MYSSTDDGCSTSARLNASSTAGSPWSLRQRPIMEPARSAGMPCAISNARPLVKIARLVSVALAIDAGAPPAGRVSSTGSKRSGAAAAAVDTLVSTGYVVVVVVVVVVASPRHSSGNAAASCVLPFFQRFSALSLADLLRTLARSRSFESRFWVHVLHRPSRRQNAMMVGLIARHSSGDRPASRASIASSSGKSHRGRRHASMSKRK